MTTSTAGREAFATRAGFVLAAAGSAIGLGNMWRFPYLASEGGGATFVLLYVGLTLLIGIPLMLAEFAIGRRGRRAPVGSLRALGGARWGRVGYMFVAAGLFILAYYSVIAGWTLRYALDALGGGFAADSGARFAEVASGPGAAAFHVGFMALTVLIVIGGVKGGIERTSLLLMPLLFVLVAGLAIWAATLPGAGEGYVVYLKPDLQELSNPAVWRAAASQALFSLSLGMGGMLTFASYLERDQNLPESGTTVAFMDFGVAFVAGLLVFPVIYSLGLAGAVGESTVGALFIALPGAFESMGAAGRIVGVLFFVALAVGALTSAISLLEVVTASVMEEFRLSRRRAAVATGAVITAIGVLPALDTDVLGLMDKIAGEFLLLAGALAIALLAGWRNRAEVREELLAGATPWWQVQVPRILAVLRWVVPPVVAIVLFFSLRETVAAVAGYFGG
jgi:NSS family neurotransmitter:Na+ symporter